jgi:hypothetical protein
MCNTNPVLVTANTSAMCLQAETSPTARDCVCKKRLQAHTDFLCRSSLESMDIWFGMFGDGACWSGCSGCPIRRYGDPIGKKA